MIVERFGEEADIKLGVEGRAVLRYQSWQDTDRTVVWVEGGGGGGWRWWLMVWREEAASGYWPCSDQSVAVRARDPVGPYERWRRSRHKHHNKIIHFKCSEVTSQYFLS